MMRKLSADMDEFIDTVRRDVSRMFESDEYTERMGTAMRSIEAKRKEMMAEVEKAAIRFVVLCRSQCGSKAGSSQESGFCEESRVQFLQWGFTIPPSQLPPAVRRGNCKGRQIMNH